MAWMHQAVQKPWHKGVLCENWGLCWLSEVKEGLCWRGAGWADRFLSQPPEPWVRNGS